MAIIVERSSPPRNQSERLHSNYPKFISTTTPTLSLPSLLPQQQCHPKRNPKSLKQSPASLFSPSHSPLRKSSRTQRQRKHTTSTSDPTRPRPQTQTRHEAYSSQTCP